MEHVGVIYMHMHTLCMYTITNILKIKSNPMKKYREETMRQLVQSSAIKTLCSVCHSNVAFNSPQCIILVLLRSILNSNAPFYDRKSFTANLNSLA